jgi:hypothetical protein
MDESMVAYFPLKNNLKDSLEGLMPVNDTDALVTGSETYLGAISRLEYSIADIPLDMSNHTIMFQFTPDAESLGTTSEWAMALSFSPAYYLGWDSPSILRVSVVDNASTQQVLNSSGFTFQSGETYLIGYTYGGGLLSIYINGKKYGGKTVSGPLQHRRNTGETMNLFVGNYYGTSTYPGLGSVRNLMVYNRALEDDEIRQLYLNIDNIYSPNDEVILL